jgi:hypothetical protein
MDKSNILVWEMTGAVLISLFGSLLHFSFDILGKWPPAALISAVNESVWEHLKLAFWPALIFAIIEWSFFRRHARNFWTAKAIGIFTMPLIIGTVFYGYTAIFNQNILWIDISLFVLAVFSGQIISFKLLLRHTFAPVAKILSIILLVLMIVSFSLFTFFPPHCFIFCDPQTGQYGILR